MEESLVKEEGSDEEKFIILFEEELNEADDSVWIGDTDTKDFDVVDVNIEDVEAYIDASIKTNLEELNFSWSCECRICSIQFDSFQDLLQHIKMKHSIENEAFLCTLEDCKETEAFDNVKLLARHIARQHCNLQSLQIYGTCIICDFRFSNFVRFNKHSCYRSLKRKAGVKNFCTCCQESFSSFMQYVFHFQFHLPERRPKVCLICEEHFESVDAFFKHVHYAHEPQAKLSCQSCDRTFQNEKLLESHMQSHKNEVSFRCSYCSKEYACERLLVYHIDTEHEIKNRKPKVEFPCHLCNKIFSTRAEHKQHLSTSHGDDSDEDADAELEVVVHLCSQCGLIGRDDKDIEQHIDSVSACANATVQQEILNAAYTCEFCSLDFKNRADLRAHRSGADGHTDGIFECPLCKQKLKDMRGLRLHIRKHKTYDAWLQSFPLRRSFMCDIGDCEEFFPDWKDLQQHKKRLHKSQTCAKCRKTFPKLIDWEKHSSICHYRPNDTFKCQTCGMHLISKMSLSIHIARSHNNENIKCPSCKAAYKDETALKNHMELFHIPIECATCSKHFKNKRNLLVHERLVHTNDHRFFCKVCKKGFFFNSDKEHHETTVHAEIIQKCAECSFTTNYVKSMKVHMAMHRKQLAFQCPHCPQAFARMQVLNIHIKRHQATKEFVCSERIMNGCDQSFICSYELNQHIKARHTNISAKNPAKRQRKPKNSEKLQKKLPDDELPEDDIDDPDIAVDNIPQMYMEELVETEEEIIIS